MEPQAAAVMMAAQGRVTEVEGVLRLVKPAADGIPLLYDSPHSGRIYPADFDSALPIEALRRGEDAFVDQLIAPAVGHGVTVLEALFPRGYIDVNRQGDDIDPALLSDPWPGLNPGPKTDLGIGLIRKVIVPGAPIYARRLSRAEVEARIADYYKPYRGILRTELDGLRSNHGQVRWIDWHSMKSVGNAATPDGARRRPDVVLGDLDGAAAGAEFRALVEDTLRKEGLSVAINDPYKGGALLQALAMPSEGIHGMQIELNRALYMDETRVEMTSGFEPLRAVIERLTATLRAWLLR